MLVNPKREQVSRKFNTYRETTGYTLHKKTPVLIDVQVPNVLSCFYMIINLFIYFVTFYTNSIQAKFN